MLDVRHFLCFETFSSNQKSLLARQLLYCDGVCLVTEKKDGLFTIFSLDWRVSSLIDWYWSSFILGVASFSGVKDCISSLLFASSCEQHEKVE